MINEEYIDDVLKAFEQREIWIMARLSSPDVEPDSEEWQQLERDYDDELRFMEAMAEDEALFHYEEQKWLKQNPHTSVYESAIKLLKEVREEGKQHTSETFIKMQIAHCVTILESCLGEMIKSVALSHERYVAHAIKNIKELKEKSIPLVELLHKEKTASLYVQQYLSGILYHKIPLVVAIYKAILQPNKYKQNSLKAVSSLIHLRHDIVHRNGKTTDGIAHTFSSDTLNETFKTVEEFLTTMKDMINEAVEFHENEQIDKDLSDNF